MKVLPELFSSRPLSALRFSWLRPNPDGVEDKTFSAY
mgnify:CR=1 FL=1